jgi:hypothetical protein
LILLLVIEGVFEAVVLAGGGSPILGLLPGLGVAVGIWWSSVRWAITILTLTGDT